ncbi:MAG: formate--tetrahydrofolate ligase [Oscillospiraceae bacterium]
MNDRQLRCIVGGLGGRANGVPHEDGFDITAASEIMAVLCLAESMADLEGAAGPHHRGLHAMTADPSRRATSRPWARWRRCCATRSSPTSVQTLEGTPAFVHGGPFANIAHGCNSVLATRMAMHRCDHAVTEAGFGADLGAEKFLDIKCRLAGLRPDAAVVVATVRALKMHGGLALNELGTEDLGALRRGVPNLLHHVRCIRDTFGLPCVVAINRFPPTPTARSHCSTELCGELGVRVVLSTVWADGGRGGEALAREVVRLCETENRFRFAYELDAPVEEKITAVVRPGLRRRGRGNPARRAQTDPRAGGARASAACRCASPRRRRACRTTLRCSARPRASP